MAEVQVSDEARDAVVVLNRLAEELQRREAITRKRLDYYRGRQRLCYASPEFSDYFGARFNGFSDNWTAPVANAPAERMNVLGIRIDSDDRETDKDLTRAWRSADCERGSSEAFVVLMATGRCYTLVWDNPDDEDSPRVTWERPDQAIVGYDSESGARKYGLKLWRDDELEFATLYTRESVWKFERPAYYRTGYTVAGLVVPSETSDRTTPYGGWEPRKGLRDEEWPIPNPLGVLPMVEHRNQTLLDDDPVSDIDGVMAMQDMINLVWAYLANALDFASLPQRVVMGADIPVIPILDNNGQVVGERPVDLNTLIQERILWLTGDASIGNWPAANLSVFSDVIERAIEHVAAQTRTPPHYLVGKVANLSAEALASAETGLVSKTGERITYVNPSIREDFALIAAVKGDEGKAKACRSGTVMWKDTQFRALGQKVDALSKLKGMGFPTRWIAEEYGLEPQEVDRLMEMIEEQAAMDPMNAVMGDVPPPKPKSPPTARPGNDPHKLPGE